MKIKKMVLCVMVISVALTLVGCPPKRLVENCPRDINSTWRTENGEMEFTVREDLRQVGTIQTPGGEIEVYFRMSQTGEIFVYPIEFLIEAEVTGYFRLSDSVETWSANYYSKDAFSVTVGQSTYFNEGDKFVFRRVDDVDASEDNT